MGGERETEHVNQWVRHHDLSPHQPDCTRGNRRCCAFVGTLVTLRCEGGTALEHASRALTSLPGRGATR